MLALGRAGSYRDPASLCSVLLYVPHGSGRLRASGCAPPHVQGRWDARASLVVALTEVLKVTQALAIRDKKNVMS